MVRSRLAGRGRPSGLARRFLGRLPKRLRRLSDDAPGLVVGRRAIRLCQTVPDEVLATGYPAHFGRQQNIGNESAATVLRLRFREHGTTALGDDRYREFEKALTDVLCAEKLILAQRPRLAKARAAIDDNDPRY